jgi:two-component system cell cycle response regulator DivK
MGGSHGTGHEGGGAVKPLVLVVDDHDDARELLAVIVQSSGYQVATAANGREAVDEASRQKPDAIIMDLFMPEMDGYEAARILKARPDLASVPILAYTARSSPSEMDSGLFAACCIKPCIPSELLEALAQVLTASQGS